MKRGTPDHPKVYDFAEALGVGRPTAIGYLELLFHFTSVYTPEGNIGKYSDKRIAAGIDWHGKPERMIEALVKTGWVDTSEAHRLVVHDWSEHVDRATKQRLARNGKTPVPKDQQVTKNSCTQSETTGTIVSHLPEPVPEPVPVYAQSLTTETRCDTSTAADPSFVEFRKACIDRQIFEVGEAAWKKAESAWNDLQIEERLLAVRDIRVRDVEAVEIRAPALPHKYLSDSRWQRPLISKQNGIVRPEPSKIPTMEEQDAMVRQMEARLAAKRSAVPA